MWPGVISFWHRMNNSWRRAVCVRPGSAQESRRALIELLEPRQLLSHTTPPVAARLLDEPITWGETLGRLSEFASGVEVGGRVVIEHLTLPGAAENDGVAVFDTVTHDLQTTLLDHPLGDAAVTIGSKAIFAGGAFLSFASN